MSFTSVANPTTWGIFFLIILTLLALDLGVFHRRPHQITAAEATIWTIVWIAIAAIFNLIVYVQFGPQRALEFATGYVIEKALSVDNIFVFAVVFSFFAVPSHLQHRVLFWGILGALIMRGIFIGIGALVIQRFHWTIYIFGGILIIGGLKLLFQRSDDAVHPDRNPLVRLAKYLIPVTSDYVGGNFLVRQNGRWMATPLLIALVAVEATDLVFAVDSIPAIFAITSDPFIVFTSNIFAIMGLRSLYFLLAAVMRKFRFLNIGLALVLVFVGIKMLASKFIHIPIALSLAVVATLIIGSIVISAMFPGRSAAFSQD